MQWADISFNPPARTLRQFGWAWLAFFGLLAAWRGLVHDNRPLGLALAALAVAVGLLGIVSPRSVRWLYVGCMVLAFPVGWVVSRVVLFIIFALFVTPLALVFKLTGRDALHRRYEPGRETYWEPKPMSADPRSYFRQF